MSIAWKIVQWTAAVGMLMTAVAVYARGVYQEPKDFVSEAFAGSPPSASKLWLTRELQSGVRDILGHELGVLRLRYWGSGVRTAWVLEETGKEALITAGFVVDQGRLDRVRILVYRESRGNEVRR